MNGFEKAIQKDEVVRYFRGEGDYFAHDPDWGTHSNIINWGEICAYLNTDRGSVNDLVAAFRKYLCDVKKTKSDAFDLLDHIGCYYYLKRKHSVLSDNGFDMVRDLSGAEKNKISEIIRLLEVCVNNSGNESEVELFSRWMRKLIEDGGPNFKEVF